MSSPSELRPDIAFPRSWRLLKRYSSLAIAHPTHARFHIPESNISVHWNARGFRKGRHPSLRFPASEKHRFRRPPYRLWGVELDDISWWVAMAFILGSVMWSVNGIFVFFPTGNEDVDHYVAGYTALVGGTLFEAGGYLMVVEALNVGNEACFGYAVETAVEEEGIAHIRSLNHKQRRGKENNAKCERSRDHTDLEMSTSGRRNGSDTRRSLDPSTDSHHEGCVEEHRWVWWGYRWHDLGYLASFIQFVAASIFWIAPISGLPGVVPEDNVALRDVFYWTPQVVGASGFVIASILFMLEAQPSWYAIQPKSLGWHVGLWNLVGAVGFLLSGVFGYWEFSPNEWGQKWGTAFSTFWGSWAFLLGSCIQLVEALNKDPATES